MGTKRSTRKEPTKGVGAKAPATLKAKAVPFRFTAPEVHSVSVAGDFNDWDIQADPLKKDRRGLWQTTLRLRPGIYEYKFVIDGAEWREDPQNPNRVPGPHGTFNSVCEVM